MKLFYIPFLATLICVLIVGVSNHTALDFDDSTHYKIEFDIPKNFNPELPELKGSLHNFYTHEKEKYQCLVEEPGHDEKEIKLKEAFLTPIELLLKLFTGPKCLHRIETYWSYEICHGKHVLQYHEEREGKYVNFEEYYLGRWTEYDTKLTTQKLKENHKADIKYKTIKIDNLNYPYFEMEMGGGTICDITNKPRVTVVRYVCYTHSKGVIYSIKETSSCNYEAIVLTSAMCPLTFFHPKETGKIDVKCFNSLTDFSKPLTLLLQELEEVQVKLEEFSVATKFRETAVDLAQSAAEAVLRLTPTPVWNDDKAWSNWDNAIDKLITKLINVNKFGITSELTDTTSDEGQGTASNAAFLTPALMSDMQPILEFLEGKNCLTGGTGWWKYEFCYGKYVRQFHKDKKADLALFLGHFNVQKHKEWLMRNPEKRHRPEIAMIWHHYEQGTTCDRTSLPREVDVKLTCIPVTLNNSPSTTYMYLLEPKTCQYILVLESPMVCVMLNYIDENGLISTEGMKKLREVSLDSEALSRQVDSTATESDHKPSESTLVDLTHRGTVEQVSDDSITEIPPPSQSFVPSMVELPHQRQVDEEGS